MPDDPKRNPLDELADSFMHRFRNGERPALSEYTDRYPELADDIREVFPALVMMHQVEDDLHHVDRDPPPDTPSDEFHPTQLGDFRIIREVGRGGMGIVYEAEQVSLGRRVALKVLPKQTLLDSKHKQRFLREAKAAARLHHTNIVPVFGVGQQDGLHYYVMQFIHGLGLDEVLVELQRLRDESQASGGRGTGGSRSATDSAPIAVSASAVAQSLITGRFERTLLVDSDSEETDPSSPPVDSQPLTLDPPDTVVAHLSDTFALSARTDHNTKHYWQSVARIGLQAAQALQYAHDQGIVHRDVKPGNLLLDTRGSVWVTDFGLAKAADQQDLTNTGDVLGTLRYMAPEQFEGEADARSDLFSLGLTLYELSALKPAIDVRDRQHLIKQVTTSAPPRLRTLDPHIPRDLETIVHKAIDREPAQRYQTAGELAADLGRFLGDEPIRARRPPVLQRLGKWTRRHRAVVVTAGLCLLVGAVLLAGTIGWAVRDRTAAHAARQARLATEVELILDDVDRLEKDERWDEALAAARRAEAALASGEGAPSVQQRVRQALNELRMVHRLEQIRLDRAVWREGGFDYAGAVASYAQAFREFGVDLDELSSVEAASRLREHPNIVLPLAAALDDFSDAQAAVNGHSDDLRLSLVDVARSLDPDPLRDRFRAVLARPATTREELAELQALAEQMNVAGQPPATLVLLAGTLVWIGHPDSAQSLLRQAQRRYPDDFWINFHLAELARNGEDDEGAIRFYTAALAARPSANAARNNLGLQLVQQNRLDEAEATFRRAIELEQEFTYAHANLGKALRKQGELEQAIACYRTAIELDPDYAAPQIGLGILLCQQNRFNEAEAAYRRAIEIDPDFAPAHFNLGSLLRQQKRFSEAETSYRQGIRLDPKDGRAHNHLGIVLFEQNRHHEAEACFRRAIELDPDHVRAHTNLGNALLEQNKPDEAEACYRWAIELDPDYANGHYNLGRLLMQLNRFDEAEASFRRVIQLDPNDSNAHNHLGILYADRNGLDEAEASYRRAIELDPDLADAHFNLGLLLDLQHRPHEAEESFRRAVELDPDHASAHHHHNLGKVLLDQDRFDEAAACLRRAIRIDADHAGAHTNLGIALYHQGRFDEAEATYLRAIELAPDTAAAHNKLGVLRNRRRRFSEAEALFRRAIELDPTYASPHVNLRDLMWKSKRFAEALAAGGRVVELRPDDANAHHVLAWYLVTCPDERLRDAPRGITLASRAIEIDPDGSGFHATLGMAHYRAGQWRAAIDALTRAIEQPGDNAAEFFFLAMAHGQIGKTEEAGEWFQKAANWMEEHDPDDEELLRYRAEAEEFLPSAATSDASTPASSAPDN